MLVVGIRPYNVFFATVVDKKGSTPDAVRQLATWIQEAGLVHFVYRTDREGAIKELFENAICAS